MNDQRNVHNYTMIVNPSIYGGFNANILYKGVSVYSFGDRTISGEDSIVQKMFDDTVRFLASGSSFAVCRMMDRIDNNL